MSHIRVARLLTLASFCLLTTALSTPALAIEPGEVSQTPSGVDIGASANVPDPGIFMVNKLMTYQANLVGMGAPPGNTPVSLNLDIEKFLFVPGWTFLGGKYSAVIAQPFASLGVGAPVNVQVVGVHNTFIVPGQLSWNLGNGFFAEAAFGIYVPDGSVSGANGTGNVGAPYWTFQPQIVLSYLNDGWNLTANIYDEINTKNRISGYTSGDILHGDFTATKRIGKWTVGPVAYFTDQVTSDTSSAAYNFANGGKFSNFALGGMLGYDFGPAAASVVVTDEVYANASGGTPGVGTTITQRGFKVFGELSYKLYSFAPDAPQPAPKQIFTK
jgi:hypothetical protein